MLVFKKACRSTSGYCFALLTAVVGLIWFFTVAAGPVLASSHNFTTQDDWRSGQLNNLNYFDQVGSLSLGQEGTWQAITVQAPNFTLYDGATVVADEDYIYLFSQYTNIFSRYTPNSDSWQELAQTPFSAAPGSSMVYLNGYIYAVFGGYQTSFARYNPITNQWQELADTPEYLYRGSSLATDGTDIYLLRGTNNTEFWKYTVADDVWNSLPGYPLTVNQGSSLDYSDGYFYALRGNNQQQFYRFSVAGNEWEQLDQVPERMNNDREVVIIDGSLYVPVGNNTTNVYKYNLDTGQWALTTSAPYPTRYVGMVYLASQSLIYFFNGNGSNRAGDSNVYLGQLIWQFDPSDDSFVALDLLPDAPDNGSDFFYDDGRLYYLLGDNQKKLFAYTIASNSWSDLAPVPNTIAEYDIKGTLVKRAGSRKFYIQRGGGGSEPGYFYVYDLDTNAWTTLPEYTTYFYHGASSAYPGSGDYLYLTMGNYRRNFIRYDLANDTWDDAAVADLPTGYEVGYGSRMFSDGTDVYVLTSGDAEAALLRYDISEDTWVEEAGLPAVPYFGSDVTVYNGKLYYQIGNYRLEVWSYDLSTKVWQRINDLQANNNSSNYHYGPYDGASLEVTETGQLFSSFGYNFGYMQSYSLGSQSYINTGSWLSPVINLNYVSAFSNVELTSVEASDSQLTVFSRTSSNGSSWDSWQEVLGGVVSSTASPYLQLRVDFAASSDQSVSPILQDLTINYVGDDQGPSDPSNFSAFSQRIAGTAISSGQDYAHAHPYFTWDDSSDSETTVSAYYVYFGPDSGGDPQTEGVVRLAANFESLSPLANDTYYLRVQAVDQAGNASNIVDAFTYTYHGPETSSLTISEGTDFANGQLSQMLNSADQLSLEHLSHGFWLEEAIDYGPSGLALGDGSGVVYSEEEDALFVMEGNGGADFARYDFDNKTWTDLSDLPAGVRYGSFLALGSSGYLYAAAGYNSNAFYLYDIAADTWIEDGIAVTPAILYRGRGTSDGQAYVYALRGNNTDSFWRYSMANNVWENLENATFEISNNVNYGSYLEHDGQNSVYAIQGGLLSGFSRYDIDSDTWTILPTLPHLATTGAFLKYYAADNYLIYYPGTYQFMYKFDVASGEWSSLAQPPVQMSNGAEAAIVGDDLYFFRGTGSYSYIYNITTDTWRYPVQGLFSTVYNGYTTYVNNYYGADMIRGNDGLLYMTWGSWSSDFISYDPSTGEVIHLADLPSGAYLGTNFAYDSTNQKIYAVIGNTDTAFYIYDIASDSWSEADDDPLARNPNWGSGLVYDGARYFYWLAGSSAYLYRYDTQATAGSRWEQMTNAPNSIYYGAELVKKGDYLYTLRGATNNPDPLYRYNINDNTWTTLTDFPNITGYNAFMLDSYNADELFACSAHNNSTKECYVYSITDDTWTSVGQAPAYIYQGAAGVGDGNGKIYMMPGRGTAQVLDSLYTYIETTETTAYQTSGSYQSATHDLGSVYDFAQLKVEQTVPDNTSVTIYTRSSSDQESWSNWISVSSKNEDDNYSYYKINSPINNYLQVKFELTSVDGIYSPTINSYSIEYYQDLTAPSNPSTAGLTVYDSEAEAVTLDSGEWYPYPAIKFDWPDAEETYGASDGAAGSGVYAYYVYLGTDSEADPASDGTLRMSSYYQVTSGDLTSGETYYLRVKTVDNADNVSTETWQPFVYQFDNTAADYPAGLAADPSGYSITDSYSFSWSAVTPEAGDSVTYCYKLNNAEGDETCTSELTVAGILPYQSGANTFLLRSKDRAGNYSAYATVNYYHSGSAPSPPTNLTVTPAINTENAFAFSWDEPSFYYGSREGLRYYYSINALPTPASVTLIGDDDSLSSGPYATLPGENVLYLLAKDEAGNIDYDLYTQVTFEANTTAPGVPLNVDIADVSVKATSSWKLAVSWEEPSDAGAGVATYKILRSTDGENFSELARTSGISYVDVRLEQTTHYYKIQACDSANNCGVASGIVSLYPDGKFTEPATLTAEPDASNITSRQATIAWSTARTCDSKIAYGKSSGEYNDLEAYNSEHVTGHSLTLVDLDPGTTYYYIAKWTDEDGNTGISDEVTFTTDPPPTVKEVLVENISISSATINFNTVGASAVAIYYGPDTSFGGLETMATSTSDSSYTLQLEGLTDDTIYYYKINALDADGNEYEGTVLDFKTLPAPKIEQVTVQQIRGTAQPTVLVSWQSNTQISSIVTYYPTANPAAARDEINVELKSGLHRMLLKSLEANTPYSLLVKGIDKVGNEALSEVLNFTTDSDTRPPAISDVKVDGSINKGVSGEDVTAQLVVTWNTDELASSQVEFGEGTGSVYAQKTQADGNLTFNHTVLVSGLTPSKVYHLRVISADATANEGKSVDVVKVTPKATDSALDLVVNNLSQVFGFLGSN